MKLAVAGKGGSGKTSISGTLARLLARQGSNVLAIDGDSNPNLALTLGIPAAEFDAMPTLPRDLLDRSGDTPTLRHGLAQIRESHAVTGPDGVVLLVMAHPQHAGTGCLCGMHATVRTIIGEAPSGNGDVCLLDTEAAPEHLSRGTARHADTMLTVVEPYFKSLETGRRMATLATDLGIPEVLLVANKVRDEHDSAAVLEFADRHGLQVAATIPYDEAFPDAERAGSAPLDQAPDSPAVEAIAKLARQLAGNGGS